jgi:hypothetical protein
LKSANITRDKPALLIVTELPEKTGKKKPVYNLEVEGLHEYYANGILVHNCFDAIKYMCLNLNSLKTPATAATVRKEMTSREKFLQEMMADE